MRLNQKVNAIKVLGLALSLACGFSLYTASSALAESESGGFIMVGVGGESESGGVYAQGASTESGGVYGNGSESESGGPTQSGAESESGGVFSNGSESESGGTSGSSTESGGPDVGYIPNYGVKTYKW